jgi:hypothetical protein
MSNPYYSQRENYVDNNMEQNPTNFGRRFHKMNIRCEAVCKAKFRHTCIIYISSVLFIIFLFSFRGGLTWTLSLLALYILMSNVEIQAYKNPTESSEMFLWKSGNQVCLRQVQIILKHLLVMLLKHSPYILQTSTTKCRKNCWCQIISCHSFFNTCSFLYLFFRKTL